MNPRIKLLPRATFERLSATATRGELLEILSEYVARPGGRPRIEPRLSEAERKARYRARIREAAESIV